MSRPILLVSASALLFGLIALVIGSVHVEVANGTPREVPAQASGASIQPPTGQPPTGTWIFAVSGDSRDCGDLVVPTLAAKIAKDSPQFYWHLGDFRLMYGIDEDMQCGPAHEHDRIHYVLHAWRDFIKNQASAFDKTPVFLGIGNHEMVFREDREDFIEKFRPWLDNATVREQRLKDNPKDNHVRTYYHWMIRGIDFINLDNAGTSLRPSELAFEEAQLAWFEEVLNRDAADPKVKTIVLGMHAALPFSISAGHSMNQSEEGAATGARVYDALWNWQTQTRKHAYVLASHSHFYMENIFNTDKLKDKVLPGWIVGTAGAHRYPLPSGPDGWKNAKDARTNVYGYLLGTVNPDGVIKFEFHEVGPEDVPSAVAKQFDPGFVDWCFKQNTDCADDDRHCEVAAQPKYDYATGIAKLHCK
ncbi:MAG TPA: metallophosphoesterase [Candidatus Angelobacter sp.]|jgi:hypothetical protein|nr:metallophosphoesterase [Candidatus Angelobacter sp.]